nr:MAG TPA: cysteine-rich protein [Caudoviricetes sp.]
MKCKNCTLIEMRVMVRNDKEVVYYCPKCHEIAKISIDEEQNILDKEKQVK